MNLLVSTTWDTTTAFDPARSYVTCTLRRTQRPTTMRHSADLMLRVDRVLAEGPLGLDPRDLRRLLDEVHAGLRTARAAAQHPTAGQMEAAYWTYQVARLQQCRRLLEARVGIRL